MIYTILNSLETHDFENARTFTRTTHTCTRSPVRITWRCARIHRPLYGSVLQEGVYHMQQRDEQWPLLSSRASTHLIEPDPFTITCRQDVYCYLSSKLHTVAE